MSKKEVIVAPAAPAAIGPYSQAIRSGTTLYLSGQIPLAPATGELVPGGVEAQITQVFLNLQEVCHAAGASLQDIVKLNIYLCDLSCFASVNAIMADFFATPYPARAAVQVAALPKGALVEMDGIAVIQ